MAFRLGVCGCMADGGSDGTGIHVIDDAVRLGYDYLELSLAHIAALSDDDFGALKARLAAAPVKCETCHNFFPPDVRLTGNGADLDRAVAYADRAMRRAAILGADVIVFGSSGAKNVPDGFSFDAAWEQIVALLKAVDPLARRHGIDIAIECLNKGESNIVNSIADGIALVEATGGTNVKLLADYYHIMLEADPAADIVRAAPYLRHVHFAEVERRSYPRAIKTEYVSFFKTLIKAGYVGRVSIEAFTSDFATDGASAAKTMRDLFAEVAP